MYKFLAVGQNSVLFLADFRIKKTKQKNNCINLIFENFMNTACGYSTGRLQNLLEFTHSFSKFN